MSSIRLKKRPPDEVAAFMDTFQAWLDGTAPLPEKEFVGPAPDHALGYTEESLRYFLGDRWEAFSKWMYGQTAAWIPGLGSVYYADDVQKFLRNDLKVYD